MFIFGFFIRNADAAAAAAWWARDKTGRSRWTADPQVHNVASLSGKDELRADPERVEE